MKKILLFLVLVLLIVPTMATDKVDLGPLVVEFALDSPHTNEVEETIQFKDHNEYSLRVTDNDSWNSFIDVYIEDFGGKTVDVSESALEGNLLDSYIPSVMKVTWLQLPASSIGGLPGVFAEETNNTGAHAAYDAAFSPDGVGDQGTIIAYVCSCSLSSKDMILPFLSNLKIRRA